MKRLALPGGGYFELPMPRGGRFVPDTNLKGFGSSSGLRGKVIAVAAGAILGGVITWAILEILD